MDVITWLLIPMGLLPVITALVLLPHVNSPSMALKERARLAQVLGFLGLAALLAALYVLFELGGAWVWLLFGLGLILVDGASGMWLWQFLNNKFRGTGPE